jgi:hypothetical protein
MEEWVTLLQSVVDGGGNDSSHFLLIRVYLTTSVAQIM